MYTYTYTYTCNTHCVWQTSEHGRLASTTCSCHLHYSLSSLNDDDHDDEDDDHDDEDDDHDDDGDEDLGDSHDDGNYYKMVMVMMVVLMEVVVIMTTTMMIIHHDQLQNMNPVIFKFQATISGVQVTVIFSPNNHIVTHLLFQDIIMIDRRTSKF